MQQKFTKMALFCIRKVETKTKSISILVFLLLVFSAPVFAQNLLPNGGFENSFTDWKNLSGDSSIATYSLADDAKEGNNSLKVEVTKLGSKSYSVQNLNTGWAAEVGKVYKINFYAKSLKNTTVLRVVQATNGYKATAFSLSTQWKFYEIIYVAVATKEKFGMHFPSLDTYFVDGITIEAFNLITDPIPASGNSSLKYLAANCGLNMANLGDRTNEPDFEQILRNDFNMLGSENGLKMKQIKKTETGAYNLTGPDAMVAYAQTNNMKLRGHTIIWHNGMPDWVNNKNWTRTELLNYLKGYIQDIVGRYKGKIDEWDVANEFVNNDGSGFRDATESVWMRNIGPEVLDSAFKWVHEVDPKAKLYYNDFGAEGLNTKSNYIYNMVKGMIERGIPIHGVGLQCHFKYDQLLTPNVTLAQEMDANIKRLGALGLEVAFTEIDVAIPTPVIPEYYKFQAITYGNLLQIALNNPNIVKTFMIWGISDKYTWIRANTDNKYDDPLFYDRDYQKKLAYDQMIAVLKANCPVNITGMSDEMSIKDQLIAFPNPSSTGLFSLNKTTTWQVYSVQGRLVLKGIGDKVDLSTYPKGFFILKTKLGTQSVITY